MNKIKLENLPEFEPLTKDKGLILAYRDGFIAALKHKRKNPYKESGHERDTTRDDELHMQWEWGNDGGQYFLMHNPTKTIKDLDVS